MANVPIPTENSTVQTFVDSLSALKTNDTANAQAITQAQTAITAMTQSADLISEEIASVKSNTDTIANTSVINPLRVDTVLFAGSSILGGIALDKETVIEQEFARKGITVNVAVDSLGGRKTHELLAQWELIKATYTGTRTLVVIQTLGNDVSAFKPFSTATEEQIKGLKKAQRDLATSIMANGNIPMFIGTTFRYYTDLGIINNEAEGAKPFNDAILNPYISSLMPSIYYKDSAYLDFYNITRNLNTSIMFEDGVHYNKHGYALLRRFAVDNIANRILGLPPIQIDRIENVVGQNPIAEPQDFLVTFGGSSIYPESDRVYCANAVNMFSVEITNLQGISLKGYVPNTLHYDVYTGVLGGGSNNESFATGDKTQTLTNDSIKNTHGDVTSDVFVDVFKVSGGVPNTNVTLEVAAYRDTTTTNRVGEYTVDGGTTIYEIDASTNTDDYIINIDTSFDNNGEVLLKGRTKAGSLYCYFSGILVKV